MTTLIWGVALKIVFNSFGHPLCTALLTRYDVRFVYWLQLIGIIAYLKKLYLKGIEF